MKTVGIICEYNPFHSGHQYQFSRIRSKYGNDAAIVCLMSGNFVQRGAPAIFDKTIRARAAVLCGADLVLELPVESCLSSAEGFADSGVRILSQICNSISFGTESMNAQELFKAASALLSPAFSELVKKILEEGCSFPAARQRTLEDILKSDKLPVFPNDILGTEYCKAILSQKLNIEVFPIARCGSYHSENMDSAFPSASAIRKAILSHVNWGTGVPVATHNLYVNAAVHTLQAGEAAILYRLRTMHDSDFEALPYGSEGLWRRFMHACRSGKNLEEIIANTKTKRYTRTRIDRMILCAYLGLTQDAMQKEAPYVRILAFNDKGRELLRKNSATISLRNVGEKTESSYWDIEQRCSDLYGLFSHLPEPPGMEAHRRVFYDRGASL